MGTLITGNFPSPGTWVTGDVPAPADWESFEQRSTQLVNADDGGTYAPSTPIVFAVTGGGHVTVTGPTVVSNGGWLSLRAGARLNLDTGEWVRLGPTHAGRKRRIMTPCILATAENPFFLRRNLSLGGVQAVANQWQLYSEAGSAYPPFPIDWQIALDVHDGATLESVTLTYRALLGAPRAGVLRVGADGYPVSLISAALGADVNGRVAAAAVDSTLTVQSWTIALDGGGDPSRLVVDRSRYSYFLIVREDQTFTGFPYVLPVLADVRLATTAPINIASPGASIDAVVANAGDFILVKDQSDRTQNGVYVFQGAATPLVPRVDMADVGFEIGSVVTVASGAINAKSYWQVQAKVQPTNSVLTAQIWATISPNALLATGTFAALGNVYHAALTDHVDIESTQWQ